ncbi:LytTR family DNA-binding domain-containing protein [Hymenobacter sp.]|uniref:LytR/AlgR family response regulator transcription factor n=1 Tax=Hymenobacter sp. TaxID=1898978 RepID=UPI00286B6B94|nr:LytTR family DNA-binding domain-containing protein [Hymenobacter sp.]
MTILIIEDEALAARKLSGFLRAHDSTAQILGPIDSVEEAVSWLNSHPQPDLIFLDVHLADGNSFSIFERVAVHAPVIFTTAYDQYALRAFEVNSVHYVLKPLTQAGIDSCFAKLTTLQRSLVSVPLPAPNYEHLVELLRKTTLAYKARFLVKAGSRIQSVPVEQVAYCYAEEGVTFLMTLRRARFAVDYTLEELEAKLDPNCFFRLNRRFIVHFQAIHEIHSHFKGRLKVALTPTYPAEIVVSSETTPAFKLWMDR